MQRNLVHTTMACVIASIVSSAAIHAQAQLPRLSLAKPDWTSEDPFSTVPSLRVLSNGTIVVADQHDVEVRLLGANGKTLRTIGHKGSGPGEYGVPSALLALPGDSTLLVDREARRVLIIAPNGEVSSTTTAPPLLGRGFEQLRWADAQSRILFAEDKDPPKKGEPGSPTFAILRWLRPRAVIDTVAVLQVEVPKPRLVKPVEKFETLTANFKTAYSAQNDWIAAPSGRVAVLHGEPYHVEWIELNRAKTVGRNVGYTPVPVTDNDRKYYEPKGPPFVRPYATVKGPFVPRASVMDESENVWVKRYGAFGSEQTSWDVFDSKGRHLGTLQLPSAHVLVALTRQYAYCLRTDADGLTWLERFAR